MQENTKKWVIRTAIASVSLGVLGMLVVAVTIMYFSFSLPKISSLSDYNPSIPSQILSKDGTVLAEVGKEKREIVRIEDVPQRVIDGFLAAEDSGFYEHTGVDYMGVLRAMLVNLRAGRVVQGGSTITQQVAKSLLLSTERSIARKIKDFLLAQKIEKRFSKRDILFLYLNQVYLGGGYYGVKAAFHGYFDKELSEATNAEIAMVAGLLVAPGKYSPYVNPEYAKKRQSYVLRRMYETQKISEQEYEAALKEKIVYRLRKPSEFKAGYFTDWVRQRVIEFVGEDEFLTQGYKVHTTLDYELQQVAEKEVLKGVKELDKRQGFKGPLGRVDFDQDLDVLKKYVQEFRENIYKDDSTFFTLTEDNKKDYEFQLKQEQFDSNWLDYQQRSEIFDKSQLVAGYNEEDPFLGFIKTGEMYKAVVTKVSHKARIVYVTVGGVPGFIPYEHFRWAHERSVSEDRQYFSFVTNPESILKAGDIVFVDIKKTGVNVLSEFEKNYLGEFKKSAYYKKNSEEIDKQKYLLCGLDQEPEAQGALVSVSPFTGEVRAFVGGVDFSKSQFNRAVQSKRQPGSSFKPFLFAAALEEGYTPSSIIMDSPEALGGADDSLNWKPSNYDGKFKGPMTFREALEKSRNIPTIKIAQDIGVPKILGFADRIGFNAKLDQDLSLALGSFGVTLVDIVKTYSIFPNGGKKINIKSILSVIDRNQQPVLYEEHKVVAAETKPEDEQPQIKSIEDLEKEMKEKVSETVVVETEKKEEKVNPFLEKLDEEQVYDQRLAYIMTNLLKGVVHFGTGRKALEISDFLGGKTGTTNNYVDAWFLGFSANLVTGVWTGFDDNKTLGWAETGSKSALPIWTDFMRAGIKKFGDVDFVAPKGIINVLIDKATGKPGEDASFVESFVEGTEPSSDKELRKFDAENAEDVKLLEDEDYYNNQ